jgi:tRNA pseudouridine55 synthase
LDLIQWEPSQVVFEVHCSKGTYIRSLGKEIAEKLGTVGHLTALRRLSCGPFQIDGSATLEQIQAAPEEFRRRGYQNFTRLLMAANQDT